jgi:hypothetical protein
MSKRCDFCRTTYDDDTLFLASPGEMFLVCENCISKATSMVARKLKQKPLLVKVKLSRV